MGQFFKGTGKKFRKLRTIATKFKCKISKLEIIVATKIDYYCKVN